MNRRELVSSLTLIAVGLASIPAAIAQKFVCSGGELSPNHKSSITRTEAGFAQLQLNPMIGDVEHSLALASPVDSIDCYASKMFLIDQISLVFTACGFVGEMSGAHAGNNKQFYMRGICAYFP